VQNYEGEVLDSRYLVEEMIGEGGMGVVYRGRHLVVGREVAIKFLSSEFSTQKDIVTRFYREAQTAAAIGHKNIIDILDVGITDRHEPYFVMEYLEGESLSSLLMRTEPVDLGAAAAILEQVLLAVSAAHGKGVVHRDLKPDNIFLVPDGVDDSITIKLIDFGISKFLNMAENDKLTRAGSALGTPCYMSPEQVSCSLEVDHRSDIYSIGVLFFEMLTKDTPHTGANHQEMMMKILTEAPRNPSDLYPGFPEAARPIIERAMASNTDDRYQSAAEMLKDVRRLNVLPEGYRTLAEYALGVVNKQCAVGDLGREIGDDENSEVPAKVFNELSEHYTPDMWTSSKNKFSSFAPRLGSRRFWMVVAVAAVVLAAGILLIRGVGKDGSGETLKAQYVPITSSVQIEAPNQNGTTEKSAVEKEVRIDIVDAPPRATILFDGVLVPSSKFFVPTGSQVVSLVVEAPGYTRFETEVVPDKDLTVVVEMSRVEKEKGKSTKKASSSSPKNVNGNNGYIQGRRRTEILKTFE
jgi:serine/threonine protein kinase